MRKHLTVHETRLWIQLRLLRGEGFHFRRQAPFLGYFLDFVCFKHRLVVEADGGGHDAEAQGRHDLIRDKVLQRRGFKTLRLSNVDIAANMEGAVAAIRAALRTPASLPFMGRVDSGPRPSGVGKGGSSRAFGDDRDFLLLASRVDPPHEGEAGG